MEIGKVGVWLSGTVRGQTNVAVQDAAREIEELGYSALWYPEALGTRECFATGALLLAATQRLTIATGIANIYARDAITMAAGARTLAEAFPDRFLLGLGVSHVEQVGPHGLDYTKPVATMRAYLDRMEAAPFGGVAPDPPLTVALAALRQRMLALSGERTAGAHPYFVNVEHTRRAREILGPGKLLMPEQAVVLETDPAKARAIARTHTPIYLRMQNYRNNLLWLGFTEDDLNAEGGSDRLVDEIVAWGDVETIAARVRAHHEAGADHVCIQPLSAGGEIPLDVLRTLAPALLG
ncbi:MAG: LLM class F420-dependent oxidoreductase [Thermoleophilia bacterium]